VDSRDVLHSFALIQGSRNTLFVCTGTLSTNTVSHFSAYCIKERDDSFSVVSIDELIYYRPYAKQLSNEMDEKILGLSIDYIFFTN